MINISNIINQEGNQFLKRVIIGGKSKTNLNKLKIPIRQNPNNSKYDICLISYDKQIACVNKKKLIQLYK